MLLSSSVHLLREQTLLFTSEDGAQSHRNFVTSKRSSNVGAIAGGTVAGVVVLAIAFGWFIRRRRQKHVEVIDPVSERTPDSGEANHEESELMIEPYVHYHMHSTQCAS